MHSLICSRSYSDFVRLLDLMERQPKQTNPYSLSAPFHLPAGKAGVGEDRMWRNRMGGRRGHDGWPVLTRTSSSFFSFFFFFCLIKYSQWFARRTKHSALSTSFVRPEEVCCSILPRLWLWNSWLSVVKLTNRILSPLPENGTNAISYLSGAISDFNA